MIKNIKNTLITQDQISLISKSLYWYIVCNIILVLNLYFLFKENSMFEMKLRIISFENIKNNNISFPNLCLAIEWLFLKIWNTYNSSFFLLLSISENPWQYISNKHKKTLKDREKTAILQGGPKKYYSIEFPEFSFCLISQCWRTWQTGNTMAQQ